jgi:hypothetical protein
VSQIVELKGLDKYNYPIGYYTLYPIR